MQTRLTHDIFQELQVLDEIFNTYNKSTANKAPYLIMLGSQVRSVFNLTILKHSHSICRLLDHFLSNSLLVIHMLSS